MNDNIKEQQHVLFGRIQMIEYEIKNLSAGLEKFYVLLERMHAIETIIKNDRTTFDFMNKINEDHEKRLKNSEDVIVKLENDIKFYKKMPKVIVKIVGGISAVLVLWGLLNANSGSLHDRNIKIRANIHESE